MNQSYPHLRPIEDQDGNPGLAETIVQLNRLLDRWLVWYRFRRAVTWGVRGLDAGLAAGLGLGLWLLWRGTLLCGEFSALIAAAASLGLLLGGVAAFTWLLPRMNAARSLDRHLNLDERLSTALELAPETAIRTPLRQQQIQDALVAARRVNFRAQLPLPFPRWELALALALTAAACFSVRFGAARFQAAQQQRAVQAAVAAEQARLEAIITRLQADPALESPQKEAVAAPVEIARQSLRASHTLADAVAALTQAEGELHRLADPQSQALSEGLRRAGQHLKPAPGSPLDIPSRKLSQGDVQAAGQSLGAIDPSQLSPSEQAGLARQLDALAESLEGLAPGLSQQLREAAGQLRAGEALAARQTLAAAAEQLVEMGGRLTQAGRAQAAAAQVEAGRQRLLQSAAAGGSQTAAGGTQTGEGRPGPEGSPSEALGTGSAGAGAGRGEGAEVGPGPEAGAAPIQPGNEPGNGGEQPYEPVSVPQRLGGSGGSEVSLPGSGQPGGQVVGQGTAPPDPGGEGQVPYSQVYPAYAETYRQAIESGQIPLPLREIVRQYFSSLEP